MKVLGMSMRLGADQVRVVQLHLLTYHQTEPNPEDQSMHAVTDQEFTRQVELIGLSGVPVIGFSSLASCFPSCGYHLGLTFDDGYQSDLHNAEILREHGYSALFCISTANIGRPGYLDREGIRDLTRMGMVVGSHSHRHAHLTGEPQGVIRCELRTSKAILEEITNGPVEFLAFPGGVYNRAVAEIALDEGYKYLLTTEWGVNHLASFGPGLLRRTMITRGLTDHAFLDILTLRRYYRHQCLYYAKQVVKRLFGDRLYTACRRKYFFSPTRRRFWLPHIKP